VTDGLLGQAEDWSMTHDLEIGSDIGGRKTLASESAKVEEGKGLGERKISEKQQCSCAS